MSDRLLVKRVEVSPFVTNCYLVGCRGSGRAALIDPGGDPELIEMMIEQAGVAGIDRIVNTHGHIDHVSAVAELQRKYGLPFHLHPGDNFILEGLPAQAAVFGFDDVGMPRVDHPLADGDEIGVGELTLKIIHTPGHSPGGVSILVDGHLFCGDTLFAGSIGRTDLPGGSHSTLIESIKTRLLGPLDGDTIALPGHGPATTLAQEKRSNPFLV